MRNSTGHSMSPCERQMRVCQLASQRQSLGLRRTFRSRLTVDRTAAATGVMMNMLFDEGSTALTRPGKGKFGSVHLTDQVQQSESALGCRSACLLDKMVDKMVDKSKLWSHQLKYQCTLVLTIEQIMNQWLCRSTTIWQLASPTIEAFKTRKISSFGTCHVRQ